MKNTIFIMLIIALAVALVGETIYIMDTQALNRSYMMRGRLSSMPVFNKNFWQPYASAFEDINKWEPLQEMEAMRKKIDNMFKDTFSRGLMQQGIVAGTLTFEPSVDIRDTTSEYIITADLPGMDKDKIDVEIKNNSLMISGEKKIEEETGQGKYYQKQREYGSFSSSITLPDNADTKSIYAKYEKGVLEIRIPKMALTAKAPQPPVKVKIN